MTRGTTIAAKPKLRRPVETWRALLVDGIVHDGDTIVRAHIDVGWGIMLSRCGTAEISIRLTSSKGPINAPEITGREAKAGMLVRDWVEAALNARPVWIVSQSLSRDVHGRTVGEIHLDSFELGLRLLNLGLVKFCEPDGKRIPFTDGELARIEQQLGGGQ